MRKGIFEFIRVLPILSLLFVWGPVTAGEGKPGWQSEWEKTLQAAKREGQVTMYVATVYEQVFQEFQKKYPEITVVFVSGPGSDIGKKVLAERRAGK